MPTGELPPRFQLALRRSLFFAICLCLWLFIGTLTFSALTAVGRKRTDTAGLVKLDAKRTELLNVLWAETISKPEADWAEMANQKLEVYEKALLNYLGYHDNSNDRSFMASLRKSFSLITTIGPVNIVAFTTFGKIFAVAYTLIGVPLCLLVLSQCGRMITSIWEGRGLAIPVAGFVFFSAIIYDIIEDGSDDVIVGTGDVTYGSMTAALTNALHSGIVPFVITLLGVALMSVVFVQLEHEIERTLHAIEFTYSRLFSKLERWMSEEKGFAANSNRIEEEDEDESDY